MSKYVGVIDGMTSSTAGDLTASFSAILSQEGVLVETGTDLKVTQAATPGMLVKVAKGSCFILRDAYVNADNTQKFWQAFLTADTEEVSIDSNSSGLTRVDLICAKINTSLSPNAEASNIFELVAVKGTPGAGRPAVPDNHLELAQISVTDGQTQILNAAITDTRTYIGLKLPNGQYGYRTQDTAGNADGQIYEDSSGNVIIRSSRSGGALKINVATNTVQQKGTENATYADIGASSAQADGWTPVTASWSYSNAYTINVPSGAASLYRKGDCIRLVQSAATKYFYVIGVTDTTLVVTGGSDYTVANSAISAIYYSHFQPVDFPDYFNITVASWATSGTAFTNAPTTPLFRMSILGRKCWLWAIFLTNGTSGGTGIFKATITSNQIPNRVDNSLGNAMNVSSTSNTGVCYISNTNEISIQKYDATAIAGNSAYFDMAMWYQY